MPDEHANFAISTIATAPSPAASGTTLSVQPDEGERFPTPPFYATVCPVEQFPTPENAEIVRVTAMDGDDVTVMTRAQQGTSARTITVGDRFYQSITAADVDDFSADPLVLGEQGSVPSAVANTAIVFSKDLGGKTALYVQFPTGDPVLLAVEA